MPDEFDQYKVPAGQETDEFAQYKAAPAQAATPSVLQVAPPPEDHSIPTTLKNLALGAARNLYDVSTPNIAHQLYKRYTGQANTLRELPQKIFMTGLTMMEGGMDSPEAPRVAEPTYPGAALPAKPSIEALQARALQQGPQPAMSPSDALSMIKTYAAKPETTVPVKLQLPKSAVKEPYSGPRNPSMESSQSTTIAQHGYHPESNTMVVQFKNGRVYEYRGVPQEIYDAYKSSESQGSFFSQNIKGRYQTNFRGSVNPGAN